VTVDAALVRAAKQAVAAGRADSVSAWFNLALQGRAEHERRLRAGAAAIPAYEAEFGVITEAEMEEQMRRDRQNAIVVRHGKIVKRPRRRRAA
jgi:hypothetical protein